MAMQIETPTPALTPAATPAPYVTLARIKAALEEVPVSRLAEVYEYLLDLQEEAADLAALEAAKGEVGIPLDDAIKELGFTREDLRQNTQAEGAA